MFVHVQERAFIAPPCATPTRAACIWTVDTVSKTGSKFRQSYTVSKWEDLVTTPTAMEHTLYLTHYSEKIVQCPSKQPKNIVHIIFLVVSATLRHG